MSLIPFNDRVEILVNTIKLRQTILHKILKGREKLSYFHAVIYPENPKKLSQKLLGLIR